MTKPDGEEDALIIPMRVLSGTPEDLLEHPTLSLANVKGLGRSKTLMRKYLDDFRRDPNQRDEPTRGWLIYGPPHCGKEFLTRVFAGERQMAFLPIPISGLTNENGPRVIRDALRIAERNKPCLLFLADVDYLHDAEINSMIKTAIIKEIAHVLDTASETFGEVIVVGTATFPWNVDSSLVGEHRFGEVLLLLPPDEPARDAIIRASLPKLKLEDDIDVEWLTKRTDGYSVADIQRLCEISYSLAEQGGRSEPTMSDLKAAFNNMRPQAAAWLDRAGHHAMVAQNTGMYDDLLDYLHARSH